MHLFIRVFELNGRVKEITLISSMHQMSIYFLKQCLQAHIGMLGKNIFMTRPNSATLLENEDIITNKEGVILAYVKSRHKNISFRASSARARNPVTEKIIIDLDQILTHRSKNGYNATILAPN
jgi:hypothetical protein